MRNNKSHQHDIKHNKSLILFVRSMWGCVCRRQWKVFAMSVTWRRRERDTSYRTSMQRRYLNFMTGKHTWNCPPSHSILFFTDLFEMSSLSCVSLLSVLSRGCLECILFSVITISASPMLVQLSSLVPVHMCLCVPGSGSCRTVWRKSAGSA